MQADGLHDWSRADLAVLAREYLLSGHLIDRAGMPQVVAEFGIDGMREVAIDEWMGASPVYTRRMQATLDFTGDDVATIFKGMQLDIGAPPQFMDFRYRVDDATHGSFWLDSCGALMDVEPMGDEFVVAMCHHIEDPTFDATACASNPRARMTPIHRPPRLPTDRHPHCHWTVEIDPTSEAVTEPEPAVRIATTRAAQVPLDSPAHDGGARADAGLSTYAGPLDPDLWLEDFSQAALVTIADEVCLQGHLLALAFSDAVEQRFGAEAARRVGHKQFVGIAGLTADRLRRAFDLGRSLDDIATVLDLHPAFRPRSYVDLRVDRSNGSDDIDRLMVSLGPCGALDESVGRAWPSLMTEGDTAALDAIVTAVEPRARSRYLGDDAGRATWEITIGDEPAPEAPEVTLTRFSTGADFVFRSR
jgi:hypothetical protein